MKRTLCLWLVFGLFVLSSAACTQVEGKPARGDVLFQDDFSDAGSGWVTWSRDVSEVAYRSGSLAMRVDQVEYDYWSRPGKRFSDTILSVDTNKLGGADNNDFGLICRYRNSDNFYAFLISSDGYYGIVRVQNGNYQVLGAETLQYSEAIQKGNSSNQILAECNGSSLALTVNNVKLAEVQDSTFAAGEVGLLAGTYDMPGVEILFDNFIVIKP